MVAGDAIDAAASQAFSAEDVAAADDDADLDALFHHVPDLPGDAVDDLWVDAVIHGAQHGLTRQFQ